MAIGWVLNEGLTVDPESGEIHDLTIRSFGIVRAQDTPRIDVEIVDDDGPPLPRASDAVFAAVAAAAWNAISRRRRRAPRRVPRVESRAAVDYAADVSATAGVPEPAIHPARSIMMLTTSTQIAKIVVHTTGEPEVEDDVLRAGDCTARGNAEKTPTPPTPRPTWASRCCGPRQRHGREQHDDREGIVSMLARRDETPLLRREILQPEDALGNDDPAKGVHDRRHDATATAEVASIGPCPAVRMNRHMRPSQNNTATIASPPT